MYYNTIQEMMLSKRKQLEDMLKLANIDDNTKETIMDVYDDGAVTAIKLQGAYNLVKQTTINNYGEDAWKKIEAGSALGYNDLLEAEKEYYYAIDGQEDDNAGSGMGF